MGFPATKLRHFPTVAALRKALHAIVKKENAAVFTDAGLDAAWPMPADYQLPAGEAAKRWDVLEAALGVFAARHQERDAPLVVMGGGAACDLGALAAALYRRGCPLILVPTTLLSQVDAGIGGKCAVDHELHGHLVKNFAGAFYPAREVWICPEFLRTLPKAERLSGAGELVKALWLKGAQVPERELRNWIATGKGAEKLAAAVRAAVAYKQAVVKRDPFDKKRIREALNYGHTLGHVFETAARGRLTHGEAIAWGMWAETLFLGSDSATPFYLKLAQLGFTFPAFLKKVPAARWEEWLRADKKNAGGKISMTVLESEGRARLLRADPKQLARFTAQLFAAAARPL